MSTAIGYTESSVMTASGRSPIEARCAGVTATYASYEVFAASVHHLLGMWPTL